MFRVETSCMFLLLVLFGLVRSDICEISDDLTNCYKKFLSFEAIGHIHKYLDNDKNGEVDSTEAAKFVRDEFTSTELPQKSRLLTTEDPLVSLPDLWLMWKNNPAFNWSTKETLQWLSDSVDLPQYTEIFVRHSVDGKSLPLLAMQNMSYLTNVLLIQNPIDKRKIMLKALDTVLFGPPHKVQVYGTKTSLVTVGFGVVLIIAIMFSQHSITLHNASVTSRRRLCPDSSSGTERALKQLQLRLDDLEQLRSVLSSWEQQNEQLSFVSKQKQSARQPEDTVQSPFKTTDSADDVTPCELGTAVMNPSEPDLLHRTGYSRLSSTVSSNSSVELALWLQLTYELEMQHHKEKIAEAEAQLSAARHACRRLNRKRYNLLGSMRLLHTDGLDELECRLMDSKRMLEQLHTEMRDRARRWSRIEALTGLELSANPGLGHLRALLGPTSSTPAENPASACSHAARNFGRTPTECMSFVSSSDVPGSQADEMTSSKDSAEFYLGPQRSYGTRSLDVVQPDELRTSGLPRSYSFVRPFANLWRRKAKCHGSEGMKK